MSQHIASRRRLGAAISLALAVSVPNVAQADSSVWTTGGPYTGGTVRALVVDPMTPSTVYAGTESEGVFQSTDSGGSWTPTNTGLTSLAVSALAIDPSTPTTLYAGTSGGVFKSTDSGGTWTTAGLTSFLVSALAIDPSTPTTIYAGTGQGQWLFKSTDGGGVWTAATLGPPSGLYWSIAALAIDPTNPATLYAAGLLRQIDSASAHILKSTDAGTTWGLVDPWTIPLPWSYGVGALAIDPTNPALLYAGTDRAGVVKSSDSGGTWMAANGGLTSLHVPALATDPVNAGTLYAGTDGGVFRSTDGGESWTAVNNGLGPLSLQVQALALDPTGATTLYAGLSVSLPGDVWQSTPPAPRGVDTDLELALSGLPDPATGGFPLTYALSVLNKGPGDARSISVSQTLPSGVTFDWAEGAGWTCGQSAGTVTCVMPALELGQASSITVQVTPGPVAAVLVSTADVTAEGVDPDPANNSASQTTTVNAPLVWMGTPTQTVVADSGRFQPGAGVTYTITLTNAGTVPQTDNPGNELDGTLPYSLTLTSASATSGTPWFDSSGFFGWNGGLPSGGSVILTIHATIKPTVTIGTTIANQATIHYDADGNGTNEATAQTDDPGAPGANDPTTFVVVSPAMSYYTLGPCRLVDTRNPDGPFGGPALVAGGNRVFPTFGHCNIPSTAHAISVNLTVTQPTAAGHLRLYPAGAPLPLTSSLNYSAGQTRPNDAVALLSGYGSLAVRCTQSTGTVHFILDVNGYFE